MGLLAGTFSARAGGIAQFPTRQKGTTHPACSSLQISLCSYPQIVLFLFREGKEDRHLSCQWGQGPQQIKMTKKIISNAVRFQCCAKLLNTYMWRVQVCLLCPSVALQGIRALSSRKQRFPTASTQPARARKGPAGGTAPSPGEEQLCCGGCNGSCLSRRSQAVRQGVYPASQTPKSLPRQEPHTHVPGRGEGRVALGTSHRQDMPMSH